MVIFPEGTRYNPQLPHVIRKSQEFAESRGMLFPMNFVYLTLYVLYVSYYDCYIIIIIIFVY